MQLTLKQFLIVCPMCFMAGFVDSIGGGGGLISLPAFLLAGLPSHMAIGTNKIQAFLSTGMSTARMWSKRFVCAKLILPSILGALGGSALGAWLNLLIDDAILSKCMVFALPVIAVIVLFGKKFLQDNGEMPEVTAGLFIKTLVICFVIGIYDGFYGPGAGTFLIIAFTLLARFDVRYANGHAKLANMATSFSSLFVYLFRGQCIVWLGLAAGLSAMLGSFLGSGLMIRNGSRIVRPVILLVIALLMAKIIIGF